MGSVSGDPLIRVLFFGSGGYRRKMAVDKVKELTGSTKSLLLPVAAVNAWQKRFRRIDGANEEFRNLQHHPGRLRSYVRTYRLR
jgi:hypothetical protein